MHSRLGVSDKLYLPEKFKGWIHNERGVSDLQAFHMAILLISKMYYGLDHGESQSHMTFDLNGRPVDGGNANHRFENEGIYMLQGVPPDTILHGYSNFINGFVNGFGKDDLDDDHFSYLLDLVSHLGESPDMLHKFEERQHWDDILKDKKNQTEWQIKWNQSICG
jgi:hypothetical protein